LLFLGVLKLCFAQHRQKQQIATFGPLLTTDPHDPSLATPSLEKTLLIYTFIALWLMKIAPGGRGRRVMPIGIKIACTQKYAMDMAQRTG